MFKLSSFLALFLLTMLSSTSGVEAIVLTCGGDEGVSCGQVVGIWFGIVIGFAILSDCIKVACSSSKKQSTAYYTTTTTTGRDGDTTEVSTNQVAIDMEAAHPPKEPLLPK